MRANTNTEDNIPELTEFFEPVQQQPEPKSLENPDDIPELSEEAVISTTHQPDIDALVAETLEKIMPTIKAEVKKAVLQRLTTLEKDLCSELENVLKDKVSAQVKDSLST